MNYKITILWNLLRSCGVGLLFIGIMGMNGNGEYLPLLVFAAIGYLFYRKFKNKANRSNNNQQHNQSSAPSHTPLRPQNTMVATGLGMIQQTDRGFDEKYFIEIASEVFFTVQKGWSQRDPSQFSHLLGDELAQGYGIAITDLEQQRQINKIDNIVIRQVKIIAAGVDTGEDFITILFRAEVNDFTIDEDSNEIVSGSETTAVDFAEEWTWSRPVRTEDWKLVAVHNHVIN